MSLGESVRRIGVEPNEFATLADVRAVLRSWQHDYNHYRPHGSLGRLTPSEFAMKGQETGPEVPKL